MNWAALTSDWQNSQFSLTLSPAVSELDRTCSSHGLSHLWYLNWTELAELSHWLFHLRNLNWTDFTVLTDSLTCGISTGQNSQLSLTFHLWYLNWTEFIVSLTLSPTVSELDRTDSSHWLFHLQYLNWTELTVLVNSLTCGIWTRQNSQFSLTVSLSVF